MNDQDIDKTKAFAAIFGGIASIAAGIAGAAGHVLAASCAGFFLIIAGVVREVQTRGTDAN
jgi:hypothetical protein